MKHTIDTKAIQELAEMSPEVKAYLIKEFPKEFPLTDHVSNICKSIVPAFVIPKHEKLNVKSGDWLISNENGYMVQFIKYVDEDTILCQHVLLGKWKIDKFLGCQFSPTTTEEIQRFIPDYKPNTNNQ